MPYYAWADREPGAMRVWLPLTVRGWAPARSTAGRPRHGRAVVDGKSREPTSARSPARPTGAAMTRVRTAPGRCVPARCTNVRP
ncbi:hypothetical protein CVT30_07425 [Streptomyces sp. AMCC400023]|nr:hypothetical protein [Streptomyces sp. FxanaA7]UJV39721.1 hypothetical protein CVT30_07425 [Streptomyces sp. AMCC400023]